MRIAVVSFSRVASDGRVLRTAQALADRGDDVHLIGFGELPRNRSVHFVSLGESPTSLAFWGSVAFAQAPAILSPALARWLSSLRPLYRRCLALLQQIRPDVIHANDLAVLPIATMLKRSTGARVIYDSHEFAREEHVDNLLWRLLCRPYAVATETGQIHEADRIITVSPGIASSLARIYSLPRTPAVVANLPRYQSVPDHAPGTRVELLYHGLMKRGRGLETLIKAVGRLKRPARLVMRGGGSPSYVTDLKRLAGRVAPTGSIVFEPPVPYDDVVTAAACADIGLFTPPLYALQVRFMLPNKLFEYLMAGLMVIVSEADDVADIVRRHDCGLVLSNVTPEALAAAIDALTLDQIRDFRQRARMSARSLCWEHERGKLIALYAELDPAQPRADPIASR